MLNNNTNYQLKTRDLSNLFQNCPLADLETAVSDNWDKIDEKILIEIFKLDKKITINVLKLIARHPSFNNNVLIEFLSSDQINSSILKELLEHKEGMIEFTLSAVVAHPKANDGLYLYILRKHHYFLNEDILNKIVDQTTSILILKEIVAMNSLLINSNLLRKITFHAFSDHSVYLSILNKYPDCINEEILIHITNCIDQPLLFHKILETCSAFIKKHKLILLKLATNCKDFSIYFHILNKYPKFLDETILDQMISNLYKNRDGIKFIMTNQLVMKKILNEYPTFIRAPGIISKVAHNISIDTEVCQLILDKYPDLINQDIIKKLILNSNISVKMRKSLIKQYNIVITKALLFSILDDMPTLLEYKFAAHCILKEQYILVDVEVIEKILAHCVQEPYGLIILEVLKNFYHLINGNIRRLIIEPARFYSPSILETLILDDNFSYLINDTNLEEILANNFANNDQLLKKILIKIANGCYDLRQRQRFLKKIIRHDNSSDLVFYEFLDPVNHSQYLNFFSTKKELLESIATHKNASENILMLIINILCNEYDSLSQLSRKPHKDMNFLDIIELFYIAGFNRNASLDVLHKMLKKLEKIKEKHRNSPSCYESRVVSHNINQLNNMKDSYKDKMKAWYILPLYRQTNYPKMDLIKNIVDFIPFKKIQVPAPFCSIFMKDLYMFNSINLESHKLSGLTIYKDKKYKSLNKNDLEDILTGENFILTKKVFDEILGVYVNKHKYNIIDILDKLLDVRFAMIDKAWLSDILSKLTGKSNYLAICNKLLRDYSYLIDGYLFKSMLLNTRYKAEFQGLISHPNLNDKLLCVVMNFKQLSNHKDLLFSALYHPHAGNKVFKIFINHLSTGKYKCLFTDLPLQEIRYIAGSAYTDTDLLKTIIDLLVLKISSLVINECSIHDNFKHFIDIIDLCTLIISNQNATHEVVEKISSDLLANPCLREYCAKNDDMINVYNNIVEQIRGKMLPLNANNKDNANYSCSTRRRYKSI